MRLFPTHRRANHRHGFSLIELSVVVAIISIVAVMGLEGVALYVNRTAKKVTEDKILVADNALRSFFKVYGRLPCPASRSLAPTNTSYGLEDCTISSYTSTSIRGGALPYRTLNLPASAAIDGYGNKFQYNVTSGMTVTSTFAATSPAIEIRTNKLQQPCSTNCQKLGDAAYVLLSFGADKRGAVGRTGNLQKACIGTGSSVAFYDLRIDSMNCLLTQYNTTNAAANLDTASIGGTIPNNVFYDPVKFNNGTQESSYIDDIFIWHSVGQL